MGKNVDKFDWSAHTAIRAHQIQIGNDEYQCKYYVVLFIIINIFYYQQYIHISSFSQDRVFPRIEGQHAVNSSLIHGEMPFEGER
jgi:hypothetical protein